MIHIRFLFLLLAAVPAVRSAAARDTLRWHNPLSEAAAPVFGRIPGAAAEPFGRILAEADSLPPAVRSLGRQSAGLYLEFRTDARDIRIRYGVRNAFAMPHMPATGVSGVDLYAVAPDGSVRWCAGRYAFRDTVRYRYAALSPEGETRYRLYLPLYNEVTFLEVGVDPAASFRFEEADSRQAVAVYGTSIVQGACASRPGMAWPSIVQRALNRPVINLGFSGSAKMEREVFRYLARTDADCYVIDCLPNMTGDLVSEIRPRLSEGIRILRSRSDAPVLLVEHGGYLGGAASDSLRRAGTVPNDSLKAVWNDLRRIFPNLHYLPAEAIGHSPDSQVDGIHPTDAGMQEYARAVLQAIRKIDSERIPNKTR